MVLVEGAILLVSLFFLAKSSSLVVENASKLSTFFGISKVAIGFLLLSVSTSLPELSVSVISSASGEGAIAMGNVFGSNIANILLVIGLGAFLYGIKIKKDELKDIALILLLTTVISAYIIFNSYIGNRALGQLEGLILLMTFVLYAIYILGKKKVEDGMIEQVTKKQALHSFLLFQLP